MRPKLLLALVGCVTLVFILSLLPWSDWKEVYANKGKWDASGSTSNPEVTSSDSAGQSALTGEQVR